MRLLTKLMTASLCFQGVCKEDLYKVLNDFYINTKANCYIIVSISVRDRNLKLTSYCLIKIHIKMFGLKIVHECSYPQLTMSKIHFFTSAAKLLRQPHTEKLEQFSFECRKVIGFAITTLRDWLKKLAPLFHPIGSETKTNCNSSAHVFPCFASALCNYYEF